MTETFDATRRRWPRTSAPGDGLYRRGPGRTHSWSEDWPFGERPRPRGPEETFPSYAPSDRARRSPFGADPMAR